MITGIGAYPYSLVAYRLSKVDIEGIYKDVIGKIVAFNPSMLDIVHESVSSFTEAPLTEDIFRYIPVGTFLAMFALLLEGEKVALYNNTVESMRTLLRIAGIPTLTTDVANQVRIITEPQLKSILSMYSKMVEHLPPIISESIIVTMLQLTTLIARFIRSIEVDKKRFPLLCSKFLTPALFLWRKSSSLEDWSTFFSSFLTATLFIDLHMKNVLSLGIELGSAEGAFKDNKKSKKRKIEALTLVPSSAATAEEEGMTMDTMSITTISHSNAYSECFFDTLSQFSILPDEKGSENTAKILRLIMATVTSSSKAILQSETVSNKDETASEPLSETRKRERFEERVVAQRYHAYRCLHVTLLTLKTLLFSPTSSSKSSYSYYLAREVLAELVVALEGRALPNHPSAERYVNALKGLYAHLLQAVSISRAEREVIEIMKMLALIVNIDHRCLLESTVDTLQTLLFEPQQVDTEKSTFLVQAKQELFLCILSIFRDLRIIEQLFRHLFTIFASNNTFQKSSFFEMLTLPKVRKEVLLALQGQLDMNIMNLWKCLSTFLSSNLAAKSETKERRSGMLLYVAMMLFKCGGRRAATSNSNLCQWIKMIILTAHFALSTHSLHGEEEKEKEKEEEKEAVVEKVFALQTISAMCRFLTVEFASTMDELTAAISLLQTDKSEGGSGGGDKCSVLQAIDELLLPSLTAFVHSHGMEEELLLEAATALYSLQVLSLNRQAKLHIVAHQHVDEELFFMCFEQTNQKDNRNRGGCWIVLLWQAMLVWPSFNHAIRSSDDKHVVDRRIQSIVQPLLHDLLLLPPSTTAFAADIAADEAIDLISSSFYLDHAHIATHLAIALTSSSSMSSARERLGLDRFRQLSVCFQHSRLDISLVVKHVTNLLAFSPSARSNKEVFTMLDHALHLLLYINNNNNYYYDKKKVKKSILTTLNNDFSGFVLASLPYFIDASTSECEVAASAMAKLIVLLGENLCDVTVKLTKVQFLIDCTNAQNGEFTLIMMLIRAVYDYYAHNYGNGDNNMMTARQQKQVLSSLHTILEATQQYDHDTNGSDFMLLMIAEHLRGLFLCRVLSFNLPEREVAEEEEEGEELTQVLQDLFSHLLLSSTHFKNSSGSGSSQGWVSLFTVLAKHIPRLLQLTFEDEHGDIKKLSLVLKAVLRTVSRSNSAIVNEMCASVLAAGIVDLFVSAAPLSDDSTTLTTTILQTIRVQLLQQFPRVDSLSCTLAVCMQGHFLRQTLLRTPAIHVCYLSSTRATFEEMLTEYLQELEQCISIVQSKEVGVLRVCVDEVWTMQQAVLTVLRTATEEDDSAREVDENDEGGIQVEEEEGIKVDAASIKQIVRMWAVKVPAFLTSLLSSCSTSVSSAFASNQQVEVLRLTRTVILLQHDFFGFVKASCAGHVPSQLSTMTNAVCYTLRLLQSLSNTHSNHNSSGGSDAAMVKENLQLTSRLIASWQTVKAAEKSLPLLFSCLIDTLAHGHHGSSHSSSGSHKKHQQQQHVLSKHQQDILHPGLFAVFEKLTTKDRQFIFKRLDNTAREVMTALNDEYNRNYRFQGN